MMILQRNSNPADHKLHKLQPFAHINMPKSIITIIILYLPIKDILNLQILDEKDDSILLHSLLYASDQNQLQFRFTRDMERVLTRTQMLQLGIKHADRNQLCVYLGKVQLQVTRLSDIVTTSRSGLKASTRDYPQQDIDCTLDKRRSSFWSSNGSRDQDKVDWLLYDLGRVVVINQISIAAFKASFQDNAPIYSFENCWIELGFNSDEFHYKTKIFNCSHTDELQNFTARKHLENKLPAARYIKFWMRGCHQKQRIDDQWYFVINFFEVRGIPLDSFLDPVPKTLELIKEKKEE